MFLSAILDLLILALLVGMGAAILRLVLQQVEPLDDLSLAFPLGVGAFTWLLFLLSWSGLPIRTAINLALLLLGGLAAFSFLRLRRRRMRLAKDPAPASPINKIRAKRASHAALGALAALVLLMILVSLARSYAEWDPLAIWSAKGYGIALEGNVLAGQRWGWHGLAYPLNIPLIITTFKVVSGDLVPGSKFVFVLFYISFLAGSYQFWMKRRVREGMALLGTLFLATVPLFFKHGSTGYANLPLAVYLTLGVIHGLQGLEQNRKDALWMSGILLGLAGWTRAEGMTFALVIIAAMLAARWALTRRLFRPWRLLAPLLILDGLWLVFANQFFAESQLGEALRSMMARLPAGELHFFALRVIAEAFLQNAFLPQHWGFLFSLSLIFVLLGYKRLRPGKHPAEFSFLLITLLLGVASVGLAYIASYLQDPKAFLTFVASLDRYIFPPAVLLGVFGIWIASEPAEAGGGA